MVAEVTAKPLNYFHGIPQPGRRLYIIDRDQVNFLVDIAVATISVCRLKTLPLAIRVVHCAIPSNVGIQDDYHLFIDPVPRRHLCLPTLASPAHPALVAQYYSFAPKLLPLPTIPSGKTFTVPKQFRLVLLTSFPLHRTGTCFTTWISDAFAIHTFRDLVYSIVNHIHTS